MADLIEIGIEVRTNTVKSATREVDQLGNSVKSAQRSASAFVAAFEQQERQLNKVVEANKRYANTAQEAARASQEFYKAMQQAKLANKDASDSASVFEKRLEQLKLKYNPLYATSRQYETMLNEINEAHRMGALNTQQFEAAQERLNQEFTQGTGVFQKYQSQFKQGFNQMGVISQQVGYQVGDFLVQVQSGTNPMVAFGQQATQLLGVLYLLPAPIMASKVALLGLSVSVTTLIASVSIILPLLTAIGTYFLRSRDAAVELDKETNTLSSTISRLNTVQKTTANGFEEGLNKAFDSSADAVGRLLSALREAEFRAAMQPIEDALDNMTVGVDKVDIALKRIVELNRLEEVGTVLSRQQENLREDSQELLDQNLLLALSYKDINSALDAIGESKTTKELVTNFAEALALAETFSGPIGKELKDTLIAAADEANILEEIIRYSSESAKELNDELEETSEKLKRIKGLMGEVAAEATVVTKETVELAKAFGASTQEVIAIQKALDEGKISATQLRGVDIDAALSPAAKSARKLAEDLGISLRTALAMTGLARESETILDPRDPRYDADAARLQRLKDMMESGELYNSTLEKVTKTTRNNTVATKDNRTAYEKAMMTAEEFANALDQQVLGAVDGLSDAFSNFLQNGMKDFKSFAKSIKDTFVKMLADMAAMALKRKILIPIATGAAAGAGSSAAADAMGQYAAGGAQAGTIGATLATGASNFMAGATATMTGTAVTGTAAGTTMAAIGAAAPYVLAAVAVIGLFTKKVKLLDEGVRVTANGVDALVESFKTTRSERLFGIIKGKSKTEFEEVAGGPFVEAVSSIQNSIVDMADTLGLSADVFKNFSYEFQLSLKGMTDEEKMNAITQELNKMGDAMAAVIPNISGMQELTAVLQQRASLERRILELEGDTQALRQLDLDATHEYNKSLLEQIHALEDAAIAAQELARVEQELAQERERIAQERYGLETRLLQLQGDTAALRQRELDALDESNRALQNQIYAAEDATKAIDEMNAALNALQENDFASLLNFQQAQASIRAGLPIANTPNAPAVQSTSNITALTNPMSTAAGEIKQMREEMKEMHKETMFAYSKMTKNSKDTRDTLRNWDVTGLPAERTA